MKLFMLLVLGLEFGNVNVIDEAIVICDRVYLVAWEPDSSSARFKLLSASVSMSVF